MLNEICAELNNKKKEVAYDAQLPQEEEKIADTPPQEEEKLEDMVVDPGVQCV